MQYTCDGGISGGTKARLLYSTLAAAAVLALSGATAGVAAPAKPHFAGEPTRVLVLGTPHLSQYPEGVKPALAPLLDRLTAWRPTVIAIEALAGRDCELYRRYAAIYGTLGDDYCWDPAPARAATGLDVPAATAESERLLAQWPAAPSAAQRRHVAAVFLAADVSASALVQWLRLAPGERRAGDGLDAALIERLGKLETSRNENYAVAAVLAARLGLDRVMPVDDHTADTTIPDEEAFGKAIEAAWNGPANARRKAEAAQDGALIADPAGLMTVYRRMNARAQDAVVFASDFGAALAEPSPQHFGRRYVAAWEARNLRMAANIRQATRDLPGARVLAIVGASHKGHYERYLALLHDIEITDTARVLR